MKALLAFVVSFCLLNQAPAQSQKKGDASLRVEYQYVRTGTYNAEVIEFDYWSTDSHAVLLSGDYALSDRWSIYAMLPFVQKRFDPSPLDLFGTGPGDPHDPNADYWIDFVPPDTRFHDDGDYHGDFQDLSFGVMYRAIDGPVWTVAPFLGYSFPVSNYPFFAKAAIGANLWNIPVGVDVSFVPLFSDWHFRGNLAYVFSEKPLGQNVDYLLGFLSAGYWVKPNLSANVFLSSKYLLDGLKLEFDFADGNPFDYPAAYDNERWWMHDRLLRHRLWSLGFSIDYFVNERYQLSASYFNSIGSDQTTEIDDAFTISLTRYFGRD